MKEDFATNSALFNMVRKIPYIVLGTGNGHASVTPLFFSLYKNQPGELCVVWRSAAHSNHSKKLVHTPSAEVIIFDSNALPGTGIGLYIEGSARVVKNLDEIEKILACLKARSDHANDDLEDYTGKAPRKSLYIMPIWRASTNGAIIYPNGKWDDTKKVIPLKDLEPLYPLPPLASCRPAGT